jgi:hypothetical protein
MRMDTMNQVVIDRIQNSWSPFIVGGRAARRWIGNKYSHADSYGFFLLRGVQASFVSFFVLQLSLKHIDLFVIRDCIM